MKIWDCFVFFNELELLEIRLHELADVVDRFVIVEGAVTFSGSKKRLNFRNQRRFRSFRSKIVYVPVFDLPVGGDTTPWAIERHQRDAILRGTVDAGPDDVLMVSDVDEIPRRGCVEVLRDHPTPVGFIQPVYYGGLNLRSRTPHAHRYWIGTRAVRAHEMTTPQELRSNRDFPSVFHDGGWHFSYLGGIKRIQEKVRAYSHQELNRSDILDPQILERRLGAGEDIFGRPNFTYDFVVLEDHPEYVLRNLKRFRHLLIQPR